jgi:hypothetical protein
MHRCGLPLTRDRRRRHDERLDSRKRVHADRRTTWISLTTNGRQAVRARRGDARRHRRSRGRPGALNPTLTAGLAATTSGRPTARHRNRTAARTRPTPTRAARWGLALPQRANERLLATSVVLPRRLPAHLRVELRQMALHPVDVTLRQIYSTARSLHHGGRCHHAAWDSGAPRRIGWVWPCPGRGSGRRPARVVTFRSRVLRDGWNVGNVGSVQGGFGVG